VRMGTMGEGSFFWMVTSEGGMLYRDDVRD